MADYIDIEQAKPPERVGNPVSYGTPENFNRCPYMSRQTFRTRSHFARISLIDGGPLGFQRARLAVAHGCTV